MLLPWTNWTRSLRIILRPRALTPHVSCLINSPKQSRLASSGTQWKSRHGRDVYARKAKVQGLKSRAAFKLLEIDAKYKIFKRGQTVVDLGYAPGSWSQVAVERTRPHGRVIGIDLIPAQPPRGVATFQGDFLSPMVQKLVKEFITQTQYDQSLKGGRYNGHCDDDLLPKHALINQPSYIDLERHSAESVGPPPGSTSTNSTSKNIVDIVLSDMSAPWEPVSGFRANSISNPYDRLMNTSGIASRDHAGSMDLCEAAFHFASDTLKPGGHLICKFYTGARDKELEEQLKLLFVEVYREKPESSRAESREAYFVALQRRSQVTINSIESSHQ
ncbi:FtsJ-like methyltransferase domain-containing protein [Trichoderma ceciliae]